MLRIHLFSIRPWQRYSCKLLQTFQCYFINDMLIADTYKYIQNRSRGIQLEEAVVLFIVVGLWACAMVMFVKQWDNIRILQPQPPRFKHAPMNLDTITIVKKPQDSVIYKTFSRKMSLTMVEREKKLLRMNTIPIMENVASLQHMKSFKKTLPTIEMEEGTAFGSAHDIVIEACSKV